MFTSRWWEPRWLRSYRRLRDQIRILFIRQELLMNDFSKLTAAVSALDAAVKALQASADVQPQIDAVTASVETITASITPVPTPPPA